MNDRINVNLRNGSSFQVIATPHNLQFESISTHCAMFRAIRHPYKNLENALIEQENGDVRDIQVFFGFQITRDRTNVFAEIRYSVKTRKDSRSYIVTEKAERFFNVEAEKDQIVRIVEPYIYEAYHFLQKPTANNMIRYFMEWAYPPKLEELIQDLTEDQRRKVARYIKKIAA